MVKGMPGKPGIMPITKMKPEAMMKAFGWASTCMARSLPRLLSSSSEATRVTIKPAHSDMSRAGMMATRPSPMVKIE